MTHWELINTETRDGFTIHAYAAPEDTNPNDQFDDNGETAEAISNGTYEWFMVKVTASKAGVELAEDYLGGCCYKNISDFISEPDGYYADMIIGVTDEANDKIAELAIA